METPGDDAPELGQGFESEETAPVVDEKEQRRAERDRKAEERRRNIAAVFGHGPGKLALVALGLFVVVAIAMAVRTMSNDPAVEAAAKDTVVDSPRAPETMVKIEPISPEDAARRAEVAAREAEEAMESGASYQPPFDPLIEAPTDATANAPATFSAREPQPVEQATPPFRADRPTSQAMASQPTQQLPATAVAVVPGGAQSPGMYYPTTTASTSGQPGDDAARQQREQQLMQQYQAATQARDQHVTERRGAALKMIEDFVGSNGENALNPAGTFTASVYGSAGLSPQATSVNTAANGPTGQPANMEPPLIKAGTAMYATLDSEMNTDDSMDVFATIRGGEWDGAKLMGRVQQGPRNVAVQFNVLAPQDPRPTMSISAVALREEDLKRGMADDINHHTFSRYTALAVASLMSGYGRAAAIVPGTTIVTPGGATITQQEKPTAEEIRGAAIGEVGVQMSNEVRRGFERPSTYSTPAGRGFVLYFTQDVDSAQAPVAASPEQQLPTQPGLSGLPQGLAPMQPAPVGLTPINSPQPGTRSQQGAFQ